MNPATSNAAAAVSLDPVSLDEVRHVADLANLELTPDELPRLAHDLNAILGHFAQLNELDTATVPPMAQLADVLGSAIQPKPLRADQLQPSIDRAAVLSQAPETDGRFFKVPKVIER